MKKILFILLILPVLSFAQVDTSKAKPHDVYCMLIVNPRAFSKKITVTVDYGIDLTSETVLQNLTDQQRKELGMFAGFASAVEALNYMSTQGWDLVNSYPIVLDKYSYVMHYVLRKKV